MDKLKRQKVSKKSMAYVNKILRFRTLGYLFVFLILSLATIVIFFGNASADTDIAISENAPKVYSSDVLGASGSQTPWYAVGTGAFDGQYSWAKVYVPVGQDTNITIDQGCGIDVGSPNVTYYMYSLNDGDGLPTESYSSANGSIGNRYADAMSNNLTCNSSMTFNRINGSSVGIRSKVKGHEGWKVFMVLAKITNGNASGDNERSFRIHASNPNVYIGSSRPISDYGIDDISTKFFGVYQRDAPSYGGSQWNYEVMISPTCNELDNAANRNVVVYDADNGVYSPQSLSMEILKSPRQSNPSWTRAAYFGSSSFGGNHATDYFGFSADNQHMYKVRIFGINWHNTLQIKIPFDQVDALPTGVNNTTSCKPNVPTGNLTVNCVDGGVGSYSISGLDNQDPPNGSANVRITDGSSVLITRQVSGTNASGTYTFKNGVNYRLSVKFGGNWTIVDNTTPSCPPGQPRPPTDQCEHRTVSDMGPQDTPTTDPKNTNSTASSEAPYYPPTTSAFASTTDTRTWAVKGSGEWGSKTWVTITDSNGNQLARKAIDNNVKDVDIGPYIPKGDKVTVQITRSEHVQIHETGNYVWVTYSTLGSGTYTCYNPQCEIRVTGDANPDYLPDDSLIAGENFTIYGKVTNPQTLHGDGTPNTEQIPIPEQVPGNAHLNLKYNGAHHDVGGPAGVNSESPETHWPGGVATPEADGKMTITVYPEFGTDPIAPPANSRYCQIRVPVYKHFKFSVGATTTLVGGSEEPSSVTYRSWVHNDEGQTATIPTSSTFSGPGVASASNTGGTYGAGDTDTLNGSAAIPTITPGNQYCTAIHADYSTGYVDLSNLGGTPLGATTPLDASDCKTIQNEPYVHFNGSDVMTGFAFNATNCAATAPTGADTQLRTYTKTTGGRSRGSGGQLAALSIGDIEGYSSANLRNILTPTGSYGLNFGNANSTAVLNDGNIVADHKLKTGGRYGVTAVCIMPDYMSKQPDGAQDYTGQPLGQSGTHAYKHTGGGTITIGNTPLVPGANNALYTDGDVKITGDISYTGANGAGGWNNVSDIPSFVIVAKGNIYIDKDVTNLDGIFIAQGNGASNGIIDTCTNREFYACQKQLVVNGAFLARKVFLNRTYSSLRYSKQGENTLYGTNHTCGTSGTDVPTNHTSDNDCASEIFNFSPEIYMSQPAMNPTSIGNFQSIVSLSPVL